MPLKTERTRRKKNLTIIIMTGLLLVLVICCFVFIVTDKEETEIESEQEQLGLNEGDAVPDDIHPKWENVEKSALDLTSFSVDENVVSYPGAKTGIDVSSHQKEIDWEKVKSAGIDFAIIQVGYRGYTEGGLFEDEYFERNIAGAVNAGVSVGVYFFSQAITTEEAAEEAKFVIETLARREIPLGVMFDWENITEGEARTDDIPAEQITEFASVFCEKVEQAGYGAGVYFNLKQAYSVYDLDELCKYDFWLAEYTVPPTYEYKISMWQYTASAYVPGVETKVDMNLRFAVD